MSISAPALATVGNDVYIGAVGPCGFDCYGSYQLTTLNLSALTTVGHTLEIAGISLTGTLDLHLLGPSIHLFSLHDSDVQGVDISSLQTVTSSFSIEYNTVLTSILADNLATIGGDFLIDYNDMLPCSVVTAITTNDGFSVGGDIYTTDNGGSGGSNCP